jgi:hypothetical protein
VEEEQEEEEEGGHNKGRSRSGRGGGGSTGPPAQETWSLGQTRRTPQPEKGRRHREKNYDDALKEKKMEVTCDHRLGATIIQVPDLF